MAVGSAALNVVVILVVSLCRIKCLGGQNFGGYIKTLCGQKADKRLGKVALGLVLVENRAAVLRPYVRTLPVGLRGVVGLKKVRRTSSAVVRFGSYSTKQAS